MISSTPAVNYEGGENLCKLERESALPRYDPGASSTSRAEKFEHQTLNPFLGLSSYFRTSLDFAIGS